MTEQNAGTENTAGTENSGAGPTTTTTSTPPANEENAVGEGGKRIEVPAEFKAALQKANKEAESFRLKLKEYEDRDKTDAQKIQEERDALKIERDALKIENMRRDVALAKGIPLEAASRLVGATREELEADADALAGVLKGAKPAFGNVTATSTSTAAGRTYKQSELNDHKFFTDNRADILLAIKEGRIITD